VLCWNKARPEVRFFQPSAVTEITSVKAVPQRLKPIRSASLLGTAEAVPFHSRMFQGGCREDILKMEMYPTQAKLDPDFLYADLTGCSECDFL
jgi:hypothetical protein